ncbi:MAG TPA: hypothetical protein PK156_33200 [Polyangium sp.]|nr:hypothetical protein [Polyangium sp.]
MADKFIDQDETQIYGPHATNAIRKRLIGKITEFDSALEFVAHQIDTSTGMVKSTVDAARAKDAERREGTKTKTSLLKDAQRLLGRFSNHLSGHDDIDRKLFFTRDGTAGSVGRGAQDVLLAVTHIATRLDDHRTAVRDRAHWHKSFDDMMKSLAPAVEFSGDAHADRRSITPEVEAARQAWLNSYMSAKCLVESVLRQLGRLEQMPTFFYDLRVSAGSKVTEMPAEEPIVADDDDKPEQG